MMVKPLTWMSIFSITTISMVACNGNHVSSEQDNIQSTSSGPVLQYMSVDLNEHPLNKTVCDPFTDNPAQNIQQGIVASLYYVTSGMAVPSSVLDFPAKTKKSDQTLFFADFNVPTRLFTKGFATQTGDSLNDDDGNMLIENFSVDFKTNFQLADADAEGTYEFALISDDGSVLQIGDNDSQGVLINNDGAHSAQMGCSTKTVNLAHGASLPMHLSYFQGPRYHIANVLIWRKASQAGKDSHCGYQGVYSFFNPDDNSAPLPWYNELVASGWNVVSADHFTIPAAASYNPCVVGTAPGISNFATIEVTSMEAYVTWQTDIPASSQVKLVDVETGAIILTVADNALRTSHSVAITGLFPENHYTAQAVSISADMGTSISSPIAFETK